LILQKFKNTEQKVQLLQKDRATL